MRYRTLVHDYLAQYRPQLLAELEAGGTLTAFLDGKAAYLKERVAYLGARLAETRPASSPEQLQSEALELALADLLPAPEPDHAGEHEPSPFSLDEAIAFVRRQPGKP